MNHQTTTKMDQTTTKMSCSLASDHRDGMPQLAYSAWIGSYPACAWPALDDPALLAFFGLSAAGPDSTTFDGKEVKMDPEPLPAPALPHGLGFGADFGSYSPEQVEKIWAAAIADPAADLAVLYDGYAANVDAQLSELVGAVEMGLRVGDGEARVKVEEVEAAVAEWRALNGEWGGAWGELGGSGLVRTGKAVGRRVRVGSRRSKRLAAKKGGRRS